MYVTLFAVDVNQYRVSRKEVLGVPENLFAFAIFCVIRICVYVVIMYALLSNRPDMMLD